MRLAQLVHFRRVDIHMDNPGVRREGIQLAGHAIVKAGTNGDQQVAFLHRQVCRLGTVHTQHTEVERVIGWHCAQSLQGTGRWHLCDGHKFAQRRYRLRHSHAAADIQHRFMRLRQHLLGLRHFGVRESIVAFYGGEERFQIALCHLHVLRNVDQNRARTA